jgi:hypothetical protein
MFLSAVLEGHEREGVLVVVGDQFGMAIGRRPTDAARTTTTHTSLRDLVEGMGDHALGQVLRGYRCDVGRLSRYVCVCVCVCACVDGCLHGVVALGHGVHCSSRMVCVRVCLLHGGVCVVVLGECRVG